MLMVYANPFSDENGAGTLFIKNNDIELCQMWVNPAADDTGSCSAIAQLAVGDSVRVTGSSANPATLHSFCSGFIGHIISDNLTA